MSRPPSFEPDAPATAPEAQAQTPPSQLPLRLGALQARRPPTGLCVRGRLDSLETISKYVLRVADHAGVGEGAGLRLRLAVEELAANTIVHGYGQRCGWLVLLGYGRGAAGVQLRDTAVAFDPASAARPAGLDRPVRERPIGGLGIHLALSSVEEYRYERVDGENRSTLVVRRREGET